jgi:hypothetical protein
MARRDRRPSRAMRLQDVSLIGFVIVVTGVLAAVVMMFGL